jgi:aspartate carbamoyltransferase
MGDKVLDKSAELRKAVSMRHEFVPQLPTGTKFFHPLPRDARHPTLPFWLDSTDFNGWDQQSQNGYFTRIVLLGMLGGLFGDDYKREAIDAPRSPSLPTLEGDFSSGPMVYGADFIKEIPLTDRVKFSRSVESGLVPIENGIVIDHLAEGQSIEQIWGLMHMVRTVLSLHQLGGQGVFRAKETKKANGIMLIPGFDISQ